MQNIPAYRRGRDIYRGTSDRGGLAGVFSILLVLVFLCIPPALVFLAETEHFRVVSSLLQLLEERPIRKYTSGAQKNDVVHLHAETKKSSVVADPAMGVTLSNALKLRRVTEYCQWRQLQSTTCEQCTREVEAKDGTILEETYDCHCITSYHYVKSWKSYRINSMMFDQPGAHDNPQRDPMPSHTFVAPEAELETRHGSTVVLDESMLQNARGTFHTVNWNLHGTPPKPSWWSWWWRKDTTRYEGIHELKDTNLSPAAQNDNFVYVGDGYFFSPYQASRAENLFKYMTEYMEGSLFDWQLGDIMPSCTAGDVRFHYQVLDPTTVSVIGQVKETKPVARLGAIQTDTRSVGMVHEGVHDIREMFKAEESESWWAAVLPRVLLVPWSAAMMNLTFAFLGRHPIGFDVVPATASVWLGFMGSFWWKLWGKSNECIAYIVASLVLFVWSMSRSEPRPGGLRAVWCMLGRWARVPPSWRVEESYSDEDVVYEKKNL